MSFVELVEAISKNTGLPKTVVAKVLRGFKNKASRALEAGESVKLPGFGSFYVVKQEKRELFGGTRVSGGRSIIRFRQSRRPHGKAGRSSR